MTDQANKYFNRIVDDLTKLVTEIHHAMKVHQSPEQELVIFYFGVQQLLDSLPSPPISLDSLIAAALCVNAFFDSNTSPTSVAGQCATTHMAAKKALEDAYHHPAASDELSFEKLQAAVNKLEAHFKEDHVSPKLSEANKSLKALQETGFQPTQEQLRAYTTAWFDVTKKLDATAENKGKQREHIASLVDIREGLSAVANRLGVLAETSVGVNIPEF